MGVFLGRAAPRDGDNGVSRLAQGLVIRRLHPERIQDVLPYELGPALLAHYLGDTRGDLVGDAPIEEGCPWSIERLDLGDLPDAAVQGGGLHVEGPVRIGQAGTMGQELADRGLAHLGLEVREVFVDGVIEAQQALVDEDQDGAGGDEFGRTEEGVEFTPPVAAEIMGQDGPRRGSEPEFGLGDLESIDQVPLQEVNGRLGIEGRAIGVLGGEAGQSMQTQKGDEDEAFYHEGSGEEGR